MRREQDRNVTDQVRNDKRGKSAMLRVKPAMTRVEVRNDERGKYANTIG